MKLLSTASGRVKCMAGVWPIVVFFCSCIAVNEYLPLA